MLLPTRHLPRLALALTLVLAPARRGAAETPIEVLLAGHRYEEAHAVLLARTAEWALEVRRNDSPEARLDWARSLLSLGMVEDRLARYEDAATNLSKALSLLEKGDGPDALRGDCLDAIGLTASHAGDFGKAERFLLEAIAVRRTAPEGEREPWLSASRDHLGLAYLEEGRYEESGKLFQESLAATAPGEAGLLAQRRGYLARYYHTLRNYARARDLLAEAVPHAAEAWGEDDPNTLALLAQLGLTTLRLGDSDQARAILEDVTTLARQHADDTTGTLRLAGFLNSLGSLELMEGHPEQAATLFREALGLLEKALGLDHLALAPLRNNLACALQETGGFEAAGALFRQSRDAYLQHMGPDHQRSVEALANLALNTLLQSGPSAARDEITAASTAAQHVLNRLIRFGTERQRLNYLQNVDILSLACSAGGDPALIANTLLATKGRLLDVLLAENPREAGPALRKFRQARENLDRLLLSPTPADPEKLAALRSELQALENEVAAEAAPSAATATPTWEDVQATLPPGSAFVDFIRFLDHTATPARETRYGALLILPDGPPQWIPLASENTLLTWLDVLHRRLDYRADRLSGGDGAAPVLELKPALRQLHQQFWEPVETLLPPATANLCLSPDASLNFVSFAVLLDGKDRFLAARYPLCNYVSSGRDLLLPPRRSDLRSARWEVFAVDSFAKPPAAEAPGPLPAQLSRVVSGLEPLAGASRETELLEPHLGPESRIHRGAEATEHTLRAIPPSPAVLHLITHGFFLGDTGGGGSGLNLQDFDDDPLPLYRSGLVLHGAKRTVAEALPPDPLEDDILYASDVATLPLRDTELVTLSSCQSALGEPLSGEGVLGLRRGFATAGARHLLLTLWPVSDAATPYYMRRFYELAGETGHLSQAAWQAQREGLAGIDPGDPEALEKAVLTIGPFLLCQRQGLTPPQAFTPPAPAKNRRPVWIGLAIGSVLAGMLYYLTHQGRRK